MISYKYRTALLIDDNLIDNLISSKIIQNSHYAEQVTVINSPKEAIDLIRQAVLTKENIPEVIFLDIRMPEMTGFDFLEKLDLIEGIEDLYLRIYILSSSLDPRDFKKIDGHRSVAKFIGKPLTEEILSSL